MRTRWESLSFRTMAPITFLERLLLVFFKACEWHALNLTGLGVENVCTSHMPKNFHLSEQVELAFVFTCRLFFALPVGGLTNRQQFIPLPSMDISHDKPTIVPDYRRREDLCLCRDGIPVFQPPVFLPCD